LAQHKARAAQVVVTVPDDAGTRRLIHKTVEFVVKEGPPFEAIIMNREYHNPAFRFLLDYSSLEARVHNVYWPCIPSVHHCHPLHRCFPVVNEPLDADACSAATTVHVKTSLEGNG
jgi:hypothetical protein